jgi:hypothetical protein
MSTIFVANTRRHETRAPTPNLDTEANDRNDGYSADVL